MVQVTRRRGVMVNPNDRKAAKKVSGYEAKTRRAQIGNENNEH
jgi:hypothetical protein